MEILFYIPILVFIIALIFRPLIKIFAYLTMALIAIGLVIYVAPFILLGGLALIATVLSFTVLMVVVHLAARY